MQTLLCDFMHWIQSLNILIYNEFSLQFELATYLRHNGYNIRFERNIKTYTSSTANFTKKEIDLVAFKGKDEMNVAKIAIELKFPRNGQVPEQMFSFIKDIKFMEDVANIPGFSETYVLCLVDDPNFYMQRPIRSRIYNYFRPSIHIPGNLPIYKPTGKSHISITLSKTYTDNWKILTSNCLDTNTGSQNNNIRYYTFKCN